MDENNKNSNKQSACYDLRRRIGELIIHQQEFDLERKQMYETKSAAYTAIVVFILTIETQYFNAVFELIKNKGCIFQIIFSSCCCKNLFLSLSFVFCLITFVLGIILLFICAAVLYARKVTVFTQEKLAKCYHGIPNDGEYVWDDIIDDCIAGGIKIEVCNNGLEKRIKYASVVLSMVVIGFIFSSVSVFFMRIL